MKAPEVIPSSTPVAGPYPHILSCCLQELNSCPAGVALYLLNCLCPEDFAVVMGLVRLNLNQPHQHAVWSEKKPDCSGSYEDLLEALQAQTKIIPAQGYGQFWLELTGRWLLTCPMDPNYYRIDEAGKELFCQILRNELLDRILNIS